MYLCEHRITLFPSSIKTLDSDKYNGQFRIQVPPIFVFGIHIFLLCRKFSRKRSDRGSYGDQ